VDRLDPYRRRSDPDRTLLSIGVANVSSSVVGGLTIIPGIVKSTANILGGGRTQWANFFNACFLLSFLLFARPLINQVPLAVLAAILVFIGYKLCRPKVWLKVAQIGPEQLLIFAVTVLVTVSTDLLIGIASGIALELVIALWYLGLWHALRDDQDPASRLSLLRRFLSFFRNPVARREQAGDTYHLHADGPLVCFNMVHLMRELRSLPPRTRRVLLHLGPRVPLIDHTTCDMLAQFQEEGGSDGHPSLTIDGWDHMKPLSSYATSMKVALLSAEGFASTAQAEAQVHASQTTD